MHRPPNTLRLYIGKIFTGITVEPDERWPGMWRVCKDGVKSEMVNLTRAKDASITLARPRGLGGKEEAHWEPSGKTRRSPAHALKRLAPSPKPPSKNNRS